MAVGLGCAWLAFAACAWLPASGVAQANGTAANAAQDQEGRRLFEAGRAAYVDGKYSDALNYFREAHQLSGRPELLFNIGQAADRLGEREQAKQAFRDYLAAVPDAGNRAEVEARIAELEQPEPTASSEFVAALPTGPQTNPARDGWYFRGALGLGGLSDSFTLHLGAVKGKASGPSAALELAAGHSVQPGLALAAVFGVEWATVNEIEIEGSPGSDGQVGVLSMFGGMIDWYVDPADGWHLQGAVVLTHMAVTGENTLPDHEPTGGGLILGGGYEWPLQDDIAIGVLGRLTATQLKGDDFTHNVIALSALFSATMF